jgi:hypothetical protein
MSENNLPSEIGSFAWGRAQVATRGAMSRHDVARLLDFNPIVPWPDDLLKPAFNAIQSAPARGR